MSRWGREPQAPSQPSQLSTDEPPVTAPATHPDQEGPDVVSPVLGSSLRGRWGDRQGQAQGRLGAPDTLVQISTETQQIIDYELGDRESEALLSAKSEESVLDGAEYSDAVCLSCNHLQMLNTEDMECHVACNTCGKERTVRSWMWQTHPRIELSKGITYQTPYYVQRILDTVQYFKLKSSNVAIHVMRKNFDPQHLLCNASCPYGMGGLHSSRSMTGGTVVVHTLLEDRIEPSMTFGVTKPTGAALAALSLKDAAAELGRESHGLGYGLFDNMLQSFTDLAKVKESPMPRMHNEEEAPPRIEIQEEGQAPQEAAVEKPPPAALAQAIRERASILHTDAITGFWEKAESLFTKDKIPCCVPVDYLLAGSDGQHEVKQPTILKHLSSSLEQRLFAAAGTDTPISKYIDPETGLLRSTVDPLSEHVVGPFDVSTLTGPKPWSSRLYVAVPNKEGPSRGGMDTYQLDVHISKVSFVEHPQFTIVNRRVAALAQMFREFHKLTKQPVPSESPLAPPHPSRRVAERKVEDFIKHMVKSAVSGVHGEAVRKAGLVVDEIWSEPHVEDGDFGKRTLAALTDFLFAATPHPYEDAVTWVPDTCDDSFTDLPSNVLISLKHWLVLEGTTFMRNFPDQELPGDLPRDFWTEPLDGMLTFSLDDRKALQIVLGLHSFTRHAIDGAIGPNTITSLQSHLLNTRSEVQGVLQLPKAIQELEAVMREHEVEPDVLRSLHDARRLRDQAIEEEVDLIRQMLDEWHALQDQGLPEGISFGLIRRYPAADVGNTTGTAFDILKSVTPQLNIQPSKELHDKLLYKCMLFVRLKDGDGRGRLAAKTEWKPMGKDFNVDFNSLVRLHLAKEPEALLIQVIQRGRGLTRSFSCGYVTVTPPFGASPFEPGAAQSSRNIAWHPFSSDVQTAGCMLVEAFWSQHEKGFPSRAPLPIINNTQLMDLKEVTKEVVAGRMDPNDPVHQPLIKRLAVRHGAALTRSKRRMVAQEQDGPLASVLLPPPHITPRQGFMDRTKLLKRRWKLIESKAPIADRQDRLLAGSRSLPVPRLPQEKDWERDPEESESDDEKNVLSTEAWQAKIRKAKALLAKKGTMRDNELLNEMVTQPIDEVQRNIFDVLIDFFQPISKLRPYRRFIDETVAEMSGEKPTLLVYIKSGSNLPVRCSAHLSEGKKSVRLAKPRGSGFGSVGLGLEESKDEKKEADVDLDVFAEVRFGVSNPKKSRSAVGPDPLFFETVKLNLPDDLKTETLAVMNDPIEVRLFDKVKSHRLGNDLHEQAEGKTVNYYEMKKFLGSCEIPFATVYNSTRSTWEGTLRLQAPAVSLAYAQQSDLPSSQEQAMNNFSTLSLYITLSPGSAPRSISDSFDALHSNEPVQLFWHAQRWLARCRSTVKNVAPSGHARMERIMALVHSTDKRATLISRYVRQDGLVPPQELLENSEIPPEFTISRFVSIIPFLETVVVRDDDTGTCWSTSLEFLETGAGDYDEHSSLLANYFQWLCHPPFRRFSEVWVVLGSTDKHLKASFVLTIDAINPDAYFLWDPVTGDRYSLHSNKCPLKDISVVYNHTNILCNVQATSLPRRMEWNLFAGRSWRPLFLDMNSVPKESCQASIGTYLPIAEEKEVRIQVLLTDELKSQMKELRSPVKNMLTTFRNLLDIHGRKVLDHVLLPAMEQAYTEGYDRGRGEGDGSEAWLAAKHTEILDYHRTSLREALSSYEMHGFPFHFPWSDFATIKRAIAHTAIHSTDPADPNVEFAIGVYTKGFFSCGNNDYLSVWVYVAVLKRSLARWP